MVLNNIGNVLRIRGDHQEAISFFNQALLKQKDYFEALCNSGISLHALGRDDEARAAYKKALEIDPDSFEVNINLGNILMELKYVPERYSLLSKSDLQ
jgi:Flp pilus assembly protein TadD